MWLLLFFFFFLGGVGGEEEEEEKKERSDFSMVAYSKLFYTGKKNKYNSYC
jgi:hypothetical protein